MGGNSSSTISKSSLFGKPEKWDLSTHLRHFIVSATVMLIYALWGSVQSYN